MARFCATELLPFCKKATVMPLEVGAAPKALPFSVMPEPALNV